MTDPFVSIYEIVFQLTIRMVDSAEIVNDTEKLRKTLKLFETIEQSTTPMSIVFPWMPTFALIKRTIAGGRLYYLFKGIMDNRKKMNHRETDALQYHIDMGDDIKLIIQVWYSLTQGSFSTFIVGAVFSGQLNTGINASFMLTYIGSSRHWYNRVRAEIDAVLNKYAPDRSLPLRQRFEAIPIEAWESEFHLLDCCLKDSIRLQLLGTMYRRNIGTEDVKIGNELIPSGAFLVCVYVIFLSPSETNADHRPTISQMFNQDPNIYLEPLKWDPSRYFPGRAEDKKRPLCWIGWEAGRHPCLGTGVSFQFSFTPHRVFVLLYTSKSNLPQSSSTVLKLRFKFAKLEQLLIVSIFLTRFDYDTCDDKGIICDAIAPPDLNAHSATKPIAPIRLRLKSRDLKAQD
ncbi:uncharacterized protein EAE97_006375 [Botrytis byssoidea]|uniref:Cytochrome P450 n=1 Tax=Botrytis byssoidea TaxID=139641 RepID=A0A9P5ILD5_9HELO|nr:uncharacterized protein EAE97_006375 [Botrytis byssoidea]KAF7942921.1 hypothetical protein EAE97_006375 [Botrytis byssoidea]